MTEISNEVLAERIDSNNRLATQRHEATNAILVEISTTVKRLDGSERERIKEHSTLDAKADAAHRRIDELKAEVEETKHRVNSINKILPSMVAAYRVGIFIMSALGVSIIALIWALITGQARITFGP